MFIVEEGTIALTQGDDAALAVALRLPDGTPYEMGEGDRLTLSVRKRPGDPLALQVRSLPGSGRLRFTAGDTKTVPAGGYSCDIQLTMADGTVCTVFPAEIVHRGCWNNFIIMPEVTQ